MSTNTAWTDYSRRKHLLALVLTGVSSVAGAIIVARLGLASVWLAFIALFAIVILRIPIIGMYLLFPALFLIPAGLKLPGQSVVNSPFDLLAIVTIGAGAFHFLDRRRHLSSSPIYAPILAIGAMLLLFMLARHGVDNDQRLLRFVQGFLLFVPILLLVEKPEQVRLLLISLLATSAVRMAILGVLSWQFAGSANVVDVSQTSLLRAADESPQTVFLGLGGASDTWPMLLVLPLFMTLALAGPKPSSRRWGWIGTISGAFFILVSGFFLSVVGLVGTILTVVLVGGVWRRNPRLVIVLVIVALLFTAWALHTVPGQALVAKWSWETEGGKLFHRQDSRVDLFVRGIRVFLSAPLIGVGGVEVFSEPSVWLWSHSFWVDAAFQFGVFYVLAWGVLFVLALRESWRLMRSSQDLGDRMWSIGVVSVILVAALMCLVNPFLLNQTPDNVFFSLVALVILWSGWRRENAQCRLVAG